MINLKKPHKTPKYQILDNRPIVVNKKKKIKISADLSCLSHGLERVKWKQSSAEKIRETNTVSP